MALILIFAVIGVFMGILSGGLIYGDSCNAVVFIRNIFSNMAAGIIIGGLFGASINFILLN